MLKLKLPTTVLHYYAIIDENKKHNFCIIWERIKKVERWTKKKQRNLEIKWSSCYVQFEHTNSQTYTLHPTKFGLWTRTVQSLWPRGSKPPRIDPLALGRIRPYAIINIRNSRRGPSTPHESPDVLMKTGPVLRWYHRHLEPPSLSYMITYYF